MNKAVFLDRDGTINKEVDFCHTKEDTMLLPGAVEGMRMLQEAGFFLIIVTNQSGIARGLFTEEEYLEYSKWFEKMLFERKVTITKTYYCPHLPEAAVEKYKAECNCRKPKIALFEQAIADNDISSENSWAIGDSDRDVAASEKLPLLGIRVFSERECLGGRVLRIRGGLKEAAEIICQRNSISEEV